MTSTGRRKIVEIVDCTGAGDVDTSVVRKLEKDYIIGLTGRKLKVPFAYLAVVVVDF